MRRSWNIPIWTGFAIVLLGFLSYLPLFVLFPVTRDIPWVNFLLMFGGACLLALGMKRAFSKPELYRGKISGSILSVLSLLMVGSFCYIIFYASKDLPASSRALQAGKPAPAFTLSGATGQPVVLSDLLKNNRAALLIFYRGYW